MLRNNDIRQVQKIVLMRRLYVYLLILRYVQLLQNQRLIKVTDTVTYTVLGEYLYNGNGQRVRKTVGNKVTYFIYDQSGNLIEEADEKGQVIADYIYLGNSPIARIDEWWEGMQLPQEPTGVTLIPGDKQLTVFWNESPAPVDGYKVHWGTESKNYTNSFDVGKTTTYTITGLTNGISYYIAVKAYADIKETYYYHTDHLGTPIMMTDKSGEKVWDGEFLPFGEDYSIRGSITNNLRFPGQYYDAETGLYQNGWRDYYSIIGRYIEKDPAGLSAGVNLYLYAKANPVRYADPFGLLSCDEVKKLAAANNLSGQNDEMIVCVCWKESSFNPNAQSSTSTARGLMQVTKPAAKDAGYDYNLLYDSATNIKAGSTYLKLRIQWAGGNVIKGLEGYGTGTGYATNILSCEKCLKDNPCDCQKCLKLIH